MVGHSFVEEIDYGNFFDNMDDLIDFPGEDIGTGFDNGESNSFPNIWPAQPETLPACDPVFSSKSNSDTSAELYVPFEEIVQLEWLSSFSDDSFSAGSLGVDTNKKEDSSSTNTDSSSSHSQFRSSSPVSVLESSSSSSPTTTSAGATAITGKRGRPRTKRPRPVVQEQKVETEKEKNTVSSVTAAESRLVIRIPKHFLSEQNQKKNKKAKVSSSGLDQERNDNHDSSSSEQLVRKCMHCEVTKTPQWRQGPMGPKTLCNACGVRYKSGRLFPEYRPAASPTFLPSVHSNSHKKVVEMRSQKCNSGPVGNTETGRSHLQELIPKNTQIAIDYS